MHRNSDFLDQDIDEERNQRDNENQDNSQALILYTPINTHPEIRYELSPEVLEIINRPIQIDYTVINQSIQNAILPTYQEIRYELSPEIREMINQPFQRIIDSFRIDYTVINQSIQNAIIPLFDASQGLELTDAQKNAIARGQQVPPATNNLTPLLLPPLNYHSYLIQHPGVETILREVNSYFNDNSTGFSFDDVAFSDRNFSFNRTNVYYNDNETGRNFNDFGFDHREFSTASSHQDDLVNQENLGIVAHTGAVAVQEEAE